MFILKHIASVFVVVALVIIAPALLAQHARPSNALLPRPRWSAAPAPRIDESKLVDLTYDFQSLRLTGMDQLWVADITYIRLKTEFVYLAVILDAFSRKVVGWALDRTLANRLTIAALEQAIVQRRPRPGLVHHSDRGLHYARGEYAAILEKYGIVPSMSRPANPYDNASCESFIKTLKREEIYANRYDNLEHLRTNIEEFIEEYYNRQRLHSALGYRSPEEFERQNRHGNSADCPCATMQVFANDGNGENEKRISLEVSGEEDSNAVLFPRPLLLLGDADEG